MRRYVDAVTCRAQILREALDDHAAARCGICDVCAEPLARDELDPGIRSAAARWLGKQHVEIASRKMWPTGLDEPSGQIPTELRAESGMALCTWGDSVWGPLVRAGKHDDHHFADDLVDAVAQMVSAWKVQPRPTWVTCVPSTRSGELVASFARRLADRLDLPFHPAVRKIRDTHQQKTRENSAQQVRNLWGAFAVPDTIPHGTVLLVDDIVDSRWTLTVVASVLRAAGCAAVVPVALADAAGSGT
jgi:ATP-dependent DNA helicase RecQ